MNITKYTDFSPMKWGQQFSVGSSHIDSQHNKLAAFYNDALVHCSGDGAKELAYFNASIEGFISFLEEHFEAEEQIFSDTDYPQSDKHILDHLKLLEKINIVKREAQNKRWKMKLYILAITLKDWLMYHFDSYDLNATEYFKEKAGLQFDSVRQAVSA